MNNRFAKILFHVIKEEKNIPLKEEKAKAAIVAIQKEIAIEEEFCKSVHDEKFEIVSLDVKNEFGNTALFYASYYGDTGIVKQLLDAKAGVNINAHDGNTPLTAASAKGHTGVVKQLLHAKADVITTNGVGNTALLLASANGHIDIVELLLEAKGDEVNTKTQRGNTVLILASLNGHIAIVRRFILLGVDLEIMNKNDQTALDVAIENEDLAMVSLLLENNAVVRHPDVLRRFLNSQANDERMNFCLGVLREQEGRPRDAKTYYQQSVKSSHPHPAAYRRLGEMYEKDRQIREAADLYSKAAKLGDTLSTRCLVTIAEKLSNSLSSPMKAEKNEIAFSHLLRKISENKQDETLLDYCRITQDIYSHLIATGLHAHLTTEQWIYLAADAMGNAYFRSPGHHLMEGIHFAIRASRKAEEQAKRLYKEEKPSKEVKEKKCSEGEAHLSQVMAAHRASLETWGMFHQLINPQHGTMDGKNDQTKQLEAFSKICSQEAAFIITKLADDHDPNVKTEIERTIFNPLA